MTWDRGDRRVYDDQDRGARQAQFDVALRTRAGSAPVADAGAAAPPDDDANKRVEQARAIGQENLKQGYCTHGEFDQQMRELDQA